MRLSKLATFPPTYSIKSQSSRRLKNDKMGRSCLLRVIRDAREPASSSAYGPLWPGRRPSSRFRWPVKPTISPRVGSQKKRPEGNGDVRRPRSEDQPGLPHPRQDEGVGARQSRRAQACRKAGAGAQARRSAGAHRCGRDLRHRSRDHRPGPPALFLGGKPFNKNFTPGHEYMGTVVALGPGVDE